MSFFDKIKDVCTFTVLNLFAS